MKGIANLKDLLHISLMIGYPTSIQHIILFLVNIYNMYILFLNSYYVADIEHFIATPIFFIQ